MTLNQVLRRVKTVCEAHKQVRSYYYGMPTDFFDEKTKQYAAVCLQDTTGSLELSGKQDVYGFKMFVLDLVHVSEDTKENEQDVMSDMREIAKDLLSEMDFSEYTDWKISSSNPVTFVYEDEGDMVAGVAVDLTITAMWDKNVCAVPTESLDFNVIPDDMRSYVAFKTGITGTTIPLSSFVDYAGNAVDLTAKKILIVMREGLPHKIIAAGTPAIRQVKLTGSNLEYLNDLSEGEETHVLYRNNI